jgi:hypothetical protein
MDRKQTIARVNAQFDRQIKKELQELQEQGVSIMPGTRTRSWYEKRLFNLTKDFRISDWKKIRDKAYWQEWTRKETDLDRLKFTLQQVQQYLVIINKTQYA